MPRLLIYVMTSDKGKAPKIEDDICILCGCKKRSIEKHAEVGDWIIGIGGKKLCNGIYDRKLIYAMKVESCNPPTSKHFTHYGDKAISINDFNEITEVKRTKYIRNNPDTYQRFDKLMNSQPRGKIGSYCCRIPCKYGFEEKEAL
ncbi:MAG: hypothetical protein ABIF85_03290 [Nanoarchaeota archaeon]|nr:hypothetical protein [Nanoarchaeota archaeon]MBU4301029.1 hypothetical protein [Nanoarchaeota archaeon]MBU4451713.1 hypothetical protein [Nanoarchaeota archaeon]